MKRTIAALSALVLMAALAPSAIAKRTSTTAVTSPDDASIQKCITDKLAASAALKGDGIAASVNGGVATLTGMTKVSGHKGGATKLAKGCGATKVTNNITVAAKAPKPEVTPKPSTTPAPKKY